MQDKLFREFLEQSGQFTEKAVTSRIAKANAAERIIGYSLDTVVADDNKMFDALVLLRPHENPKHNPMQNAVRKYYIFKNGKEFPQLRYYKR
ncbi:MAG: hypothetical protein IKT37_04620 [Clostridia bacterium]|nr:hypothetical protein [Clostridia bacterium]